VTRRKKRRLLEKPHSWFSTDSIVPSKLTLVYARNTSPVIPRPDTSVRVTNRRTWWMARRSAGFSLKFRSTYGVMTCLTNVS
jgi:hypothetical protein